MATRFRREADAFRNSLIINNVTLMVNTNNQPYITVLTPVYNRATLLPRLLDSLLRQTFKDFEWIVVDDGSTDNTQEVLAKLKQRCGDAFPMTCLYKDNGGKHMAINMGVTHARGELFFIVDSDDMLPPTRLPPWLRSGGPSAATTASPAWQVSTWRWTTTR